jgi:ATP-binding cassette subfamily C protein CydD
MTGVVFLATLPLLPVFMVLAGRSAERASQRQWATLARLGGHMLDAVAGLADLKLARAATRQVAVVAAMAEGYRKTTMSVLRIAFLSALVLEFFATVAIAVTAVLVGFRLMWGEIDFHTGFFLLLLAPEFYAPLRQMGVNRHAKMEAIAAAERIVALLDRPAPEPTAGRGRPIAPGPAVGLTFDRVGAGYGDGRVALADVSFAVAPGEHVAIVGASGTGKSTLFALLLGFLQPTTGRILVDGVPLADLDLDDWRRHLVHVPQRPHLFDGSIADNVAMDRAPEAGATVAEAVAVALRAARAEAVVAALPDGAGTRLGDRVSGLSGGEAQRLALARAFFRSGPLILFDEPTAHLDPATERDVAEAIAAFAAGRTLLTIAHRLDTIRRADRILVLDAGRLVESGRYDDLAAAGGPFARLVAAAGGGDAAGEPAP